MAGRPQISRSAASGSPTPGFVEGKFQSPPPRALHVSRERIVDPLRADPLAKLILASAPAGYGKSTVLAEWGRMDERVSLAWLALDEEESDPYRFWVAVVHALRTVASERFGPVLSALHATLPFAESVLPRLTSEIGRLEDRVLLVLDDFHRVHGPAVSHEVTRLLERLPPQMRLAIATRADPALPVARLRTLGELTELRATDLAFSEGEARELLRGRLALGLDDDDVSRLVVLTEGWPAGLYLASLWLRGSTDVHAAVAEFSGSQRFVADYLTSELLAQQPPDRIDFLLRSSHLSEFCAPLLDAVLQRRDSADVLAELDQSNLFVVPVDGTRSWYRFHHLFRDLLRAQLAQRRPAALADLDGRASAWYADNGLVDRAIEHALAAGDLRRAADLLATHWWEFIEAHRHAALKRWLESLPPADVEADPRLCLVWAWISSSLGMPEDVHRWLVLAERGEWEGPLPDGRSSVASAVAIVRGALAVGDVGFQVAAGRTAAGLERDGAPAWRGVAEGGLGIGLYYLGDLPGAEESLERGGSLLDATGQHLAWSIVTAYRALCALERNRVDEAARLVRESLARAEAHHVDEHPRMSLARAVLGLALGETGAFDGALDELGRGIAQVEGSAFLLDEATARLAHARVLHAAGRRDDARAAAAAAAQVVEACADPGIMPLRLAETRRLVGHSAVAEGADASIDLTARELEVLALLPARLSQREIADALFVSFNTVATHVRSIYRKLGVTSRRGAVERAFALEILVEPVAPPIVGEGLGGERLRPAS